MVSERIIVFQGWIHNKDGLFTSDVYKDSQINAMYYWPDQISSNIDVNDALVNSIKFLIHEFRTKNGKNTQGWGSINGTYNDCYWEEFGLNS